MRVMGKLGCVGWLLVSVLFTDATATLPESVLERAEAIGGAEQDLIGDPQLVRVVVNEVHRAISYVPRKLGWAEICSGKAGNTKAVEQLGVPGATFDRLDDPAEDLCTAGGLMYAGFIVLCIVAGGSLWLSPECCTWLPFVSIRHSKRNRAGHSLEGDTTRRDVQEANHCAYACAWLASLARSLHVWVTIENPMNSLLFTWPSVVALGLDRFLTYGGAFGGTSEKPFELRSSIPSRILQKYLKKTRKQARERVSTNPCKAKLTVKLGRWITGTKAMTNSAAYPSEMSARVADMVVELLYTPPCVEVTES